MRFIADLHIHSPFSMATSRQTTPAALYRFARLKGIGLVATGDFTHPEWRKILKRDLEPAEPGLFRLREDLAKEADADLPASCRGETRFILSAEVSNIYKRADKTRKVHNLLYAPTLAEAAAVGGDIARRGAKIRSDGRPISKIDSEDLLRLFFGHCPEGFAVPAHVWTPHFSVLGAFNRFASLEECYGEQTERLFAVETGLSSDPPMNWRLSSLDRMTLISNSDAHSPSKLGREANLFDADLSFAGVRDALRFPERGEFLGTLEFYPEEGKYHLDGHRACGRRMTPEETRQHEGRCPDCGRKVTVGVVHRVAELADREQGFRPEGAPGFESVIALKTVLSEVLGVGENTKRVAREYDRVVAAFGGELAVLREAPIEAIEGEGPPRLAEALARVRTGDVRVEAGYDGEYGVVRVFEQRLEVGG